MAEWGKKIASGRDLNQLTVTPPVAKFLLAERLRGFGGDHALEPDQFVALDRLIAKIRAHGDAIMIVDLAMPRWHTEGVPLATASYEAGIRWVRSRHAADHRSIICRFTIWIRATTSSIRPTPNRACGTCGAIGCRIA